MRGADRMYAEAVFRTRVVYDKTWWVTESIDFVSAVV